VHGPVDLEQRAEVTLQTVLGPAQVAGVGGCLAGDEGLGLVGLQRVLPADEALVVGVDDASVGGPQLHPQHRSVGEQPAGRPHLGERRRVAGEQAVTQVGLDDGARDDAVHSLRVTQRLVLGHGSAHQRATDRDQGHHHHAGQREVHQRAAWGVGVAATADRGGAVRGPGGAAHGPGGAVRRRRGDHAAGPLLPPEAADEIQSAPRSDGLPKPHRGVFDPRNRGVGGVSRRRARGPGRGRALSPNA
jgi:hypothetical protein